MLVGSFVNCQNPTKMHGKILYHVRNTTGFNIPLRFIVQWVSKSLCSSQLVASLALPILFSVNWNTSYTKPGERRWTEHRRRSTFENVVYIIYRTRTRKLVFKSHPQDFLINWEYLLARYFLYRSLYLTLWNKTWISPFANCMQLYFG